MAVFSVVDFSSCNSLKTLYRQPSLLLLPVFTCFTFSRISSGGCGQADNRVRFSKKMTAVNMALTLAGIISWGIYVSFESKGLGAVVGTIFFSLYFLPGLVFTLLFLLYDKLCCCCCTCCLSPPEEIAVYDPDKPETQFKLDKETNCIV